MTSLTLHPSLQKRHVLVTVGVLCAHGIALWLLLMAFQRPTPPSIVPADIVVQWVTLATPVPTPPSPPQPTPVHKPQPKVVRPTALPTPAPVSTTTDTPVAASTATSASDSPPTQTAAPAAASVVAAPVAAPKLELPSSDASYLNNPRPPYPPLSKRLGEQGKVVLRVYIETNGSASQAEIRTSSGYDRLDQTALKTVLSWRYVPGKRNGVPEAMWFNVPIQFVLE